MRSLLIIAHGSRRESSNDEVRGLSTAVSALLDGRYDRCACAFLELAEPDIVEAIDREAAAGATEVVCFPYFLSAGRHVVTDVPEQVEKARARHPDLAIRLERYLGAQREMAGFIARAIP